MISTLDTAAAALRDAGFRVVLVSAGATLATDVVLSVREDFGFGYVVARWWGDGKRYLEVASTLARARRALERSGLYVTDGGGRSLEIAGEAEPCGLRECAAAAQGRDWRAMRAETQARMARERAA